MWHTVVHRSTTCGRAYRRTDRRADIEASFIRSNKPTDVTLKIENNRHSLGFVVRVPDNMKIFFRSKNYNPKAGKVMCVFLLLPLVSVNKGLCLFLCRKMCYF